MKSELYTYYLKRFSALALGVALFAALVPSVVVPFISSNFGDESYLLVPIEWLSSRIALVVYLVAGEWLIRNRLWQFEMAEFDFQGVWNATTHYSNAALTLGRSHESFSSSHQAIITQDCVQIEISPTESGGYLNWGSSSIRIEDRNTLIYSYWVNYQDDVRFPDRAQGVERLKVVKRDQKGRPIRMSGTFSHCAEGQSPIYYGRVEFEKN